MAAVNLVSFADMIEMHCPAVNIAHRGRQKAKSAEFTLEEREPVHEISTLTSGRTGAKQDHFNLAESTASCRDALAMPIKATESKYRKEQGHACLPADSKRVVLIKLTPPQSRP